MVNIFNAQEKEQDKSLSLNCFTTRGVVLSPDESLHEALQQARLSPPVLRMNHSFSRLLTSPSVFFPFQRRWRRLPRGPPRRKTKWTGTGSPTSRRNPRRREVRLYSNFLVLTRESGCLSGLGTPCDRASRGLAGAPPGGKGGANTADEIYISKIK